MFETADPKQPFFVLNQVELFPKDDEVLIKLYQPLVGANAIALYQTLIQDFDPYSILTDAKGLYYLQEQLDCSLKKLFNSLHKLEATGLVKTYLVNNVVNEVLAFKLLNVPSAAEYFGTPLLASLLKEKVGVTSFHELSHHFAKKAQSKQKQIKNARDISASFLDVFRLPGDEAISPSEDVLQAGQDNRDIAVGKAEVNNRDTVDWQFLADQFAFYHIPQSEIDKNKERIRGVMQTYGLSEKEFVDEILPSLHGSRKLNLSVIENMIADNYKSSTTRKELQRNRERQPQVSISFTADKQKLLDAAEQDSPAEFLYKLKSEKGGFASPGEKRTLNVLRTQYGLPADLINILVYTCLTYDTMVSTRLAYRIANDWMQHGIATAAQALQYVAQRRQKYTEKSNNKRVFKQNKRVEKGTNWKEKKAKIKPNVDSDELKNFFKNMENQSGMK